MLFSLLLLLPFAFSTELAKNSDCLNVAPFQVVTINSAGLLEVPQSAQSLLTNCFGVDFHVVSATGPFHSGKSFMLNALINRTQSQFQVGQTTESTTRGLWIHGAPLTRDGIAYPVVFLDTEGLAATENTDLHDAKIYSIATLISAHQLFNTIRNIDASSVEQLELLARRARLFQLKSGLTEIEGANQKTASFLNTEEGALLKFPSLTWVVQNFFQKQLPGETPTKWLHRLLTAVVRTKQIGSASITNSDRQGPLLIDHPSNDNDAIDHSSLTIAREKSTLKNIFEPLEAVTMQIPSFDSSKLQDLSKSDMKQLNSEYIQDLNKLWKKIESSLSLPNVRKQSGSTLHSFLKVLVKSTNSKNLQNLPSIWQQHIDRQKKDAQNAVGSIFKSRSSKYDLSVPLPMNAYKNDMKRIAKAANRNVVELLFGLSTPTIETTKKMISGHIGNLKSKKEESNLKQIRSFVDGKRKNIQNKGENDISSIKIPTASNNIRRDYQVTKKEVTSSFNTEIVAYDTKHTSPYSDQLNKGLENALRKKLETNEKEMRKIIKNGRSDGKKAFEKMFDDADFPGKNCYIPKELTDLTKDAVKASTTAFDSTTEIVKTEKQYYSKERSSALALIRETDKKYINENENCIKRVVKSYENTANRHFREKSRELENTFPQFEDDDIPKVNKANTETMLSLFNKQAVRFSYHNAFKKTMAGLKTMAKSELKDLIRRNTDEIKKSVSPILRDIKSRGWLKQNNCPHGFSGGSCAGWFKELVTDDVTRSLKREWNNDPVKMKHVTKVISRFLNRDLAKPFQKNKDLDAANAKLKMGLGVAAIAICVGLYFKTKNDNDNN